MQRIVFGLKDVYNAQCENAGIGLTSSALELNIPGLSLGFIAGGQDPIVSDIIRLDFATDTATDTGNNMSRAYTGAHDAGLASPNFGYFGGGYSPSVPGHVCYIDRLDFSNETSAQFGSSMTQRRGNLGAVSTQEYGYFAGGFIPTASAGYSTIDKLEFSTDTVSNLPANLPQARLNMCRVTSSSYGYFIGGQNPNYTCRVDRIDFSVETTSAPGNNMPVARTAPMGGTQSLGYGYFAGGANGGGYTSDIFRLDFSDDTISTPSANLSLARGDGSGVTSLSHGYWCGGYTGGYQDNIDKFEYTTETSSNPGNMPANRMGQFGVSINRPQVFRHIPGNGEWKESPNHGYFCGGYSTTNINTMDRIDFASETTSAPGNNLIQAGNAAGGIFNTNYAYVGGGQGNGNWSTISRLEFQTDTIVNSPAKQTFTAGGSAGISAKGKGYFAGNASGSPDSCTVDRLDFTTETVTANTPIGQSKREPVGTQTEDYGYCVGGRSNQLGINWSTINRVDFATDIFTTIPSVLSEGDRNKAAVQNTKNAYFCLGGGGTVCTVERMEFSTETVSEINGFGPPRWSPAGVSNFSYGFIAGGMDPAIPANVTTINRLDLDTETSSTPSSKLNLAKRLMPGVSGGVSTRRVGKATYGYWAGGWTGSVRTSTIDRIDFSTETIRNVGDLLIETADSTSTESAIHGYIAGGISPDSAPSPTTAIARMDFSNETVSANPSQLSPARRYAGSCSNSNYGYFAGGNPYRCTIDRLDFSTATVSAPGKNLTESKGYFEGANNTSYGYFAGGYNGSIDLQTIDRIDFATETVADIGNNTQDRNNIGAFESPTYGYFFGGADPSGRLCTIDRIEFSTETISANPGQLTQPRNSVRGTRDSQYGWMAGGSSPTYVSTIDRLDFASDTVSLPTQSLTQARGATAAWSNG